jgi:3-keto-disaccharide hydrolase
MMRIQRILLPVLACLLLAPPCVPAAQKHGKAVRLFDGKDLKGFYVFIKGHGKNNDPNHVFTVEHGMIHVSGAEFGYIATEKEYSHFRLTCDFKWGEAVYPPQAGKARDSGILYYFQGPDKVWPTSVEFQITEGGTGDFWMTDGASLTRDGLTVTGPPGGAKPIDRFNKGPWKDVTGYRDPTGEVEKPHGQWNHLELIADGPTVTQYVNGKLVNRGTDAHPDSGKILFQSEGAEIYFRNIELAPLE